MQKEEKDISKRVGYSFSAAVREQSSNRCPSEVFLGQPDFSSPDTEPMEISWLNLQCID
jgi:hypothetical protein